MNERRMQIWITVGVLALAAFLLFAGNVVASDPASLSDAATLQNTTSWSSGWVDIATDTAQTFTHNLGGNPDDYAVELWFRDTATGGKGVNSWGIGGFEAGGNFRGAHWQNLTDTSINVVRWPDDVAGLAFCGAVIGDWQWARDVIEASEIPHVPFDPDAISRDPEAGASYASDPLVYHGQYKRPLLVAEVAALDAFARDLHRLTMPVLLLHGTADPFVPYERSLQAVRDMPTDDVTVHLYDGGRHEILNETNREEVIGDLAAWIDRIS